MRPSTALRLKGLAEGHFHTVRSFDPRFGGYAALPWVFRTLLATMTPRQWMVLTYLYLRVGPEGLTWAADEQIGTDLKIGPKKLSPYFKKLEERGFIAVKRLGHRRYVKLVDPMLVARRLLADPASDLKPAVRQRLQEDLELIRQTRRKRQSLVGAADGDQGGAGDV